MSVFVKNYTDVSGNRIISKREFKDVSVVFQGKNNLLHLDDECYLMKGQIKFTGNNAKVVLGKNSPKKPHLLNMRIGEDSTVEIGAGLTIEKNASFFASEGARILIGRDCMIASNVQFRADDSHPIFTVADGKRINLSRDIIVGDHCWIAYEATLLKGTEIGSGSVVALRSIVTKPFPNNCLIGGVPATLLKKDIIWERPNVATTLPAYKYSSKDVKVSQQFWSLTKTETLVDNLKSLYDKKDWQAIIKNCSVQMDLLDADSLYMLGYAYYMTKQYAKSLEVFIKSEKSNLQGEFRNNLNKVLGNTYFKIKSFELSYACFFYEIQKNPYDTVSVRMALISSLMSEDVKRAKQLLNSVEKIWKRNDFLRMLVSSIQYVEKNGTWRQQNACRELLYDVEVLLPSIKISSSRRDAVNTAYLFIQPLLGHDQLFCNKLFSCPVFFIKQNFCYAYFLPYLEGNLNEVSRKLLHLKINKLVLLSSSAGAYFALLFALKLAERFENITFEVHAFAPQTNVNNNNNIKNVSHYKELNMLQALYPHLAENVERYGDLAKLWDNNLKNLSANIYYGSEAEVDVNEVDYLKRNNIDLKYTVLEGFPYHTVLPVFRYDSEKLRQVFGTFAALTPESGKVIKKQCTLEYCIQLKRKNNFDLNKLLPYMKQ